MSTTRAAPKTLADWAALPEDARIELIDGEFVEKAAPSPEHALAQAAAAGELRHAYGRKLGGPHGPGGWWFMTEVDVTFGGRIYRPDIAAWRRDRHASLPNERPLGVRPDWICEILSASNRRHGTVKKLTRYHEAGIDHYWWLDHTDRTLTVHRYSRDGYIIVLRAEEGERVRAEPFDAIELEVSVLLGGDPE